jgi:hypothetical protein
MIGHEEWNTLRNELAPISDSYLRQTLRASGVPLCASVAGVSLESLEALEASLIAVADEYDHSDRTGKKACRDAVIAGKDRARWSIKRASDDPAKQAVREEMVLWMLTWLENPAIFSSWAKLRRPGLKPVTG